MASKLKDGQRQFVYVESSGKLIGAFECPKKRLKIGDTLKLDEISYVVWYVEETATMRNVRIETLN
jgi:hypothetical protein